MAVVAVGGVDDVAVAVAATLAADNIHPLDSRACNKRNQFDKIVPCKPLVNRS